MEAINFPDQDNNINNTIDNKENIPPSPPLSTKQNKNPILKSVPTSKKTCRWMCRRPLDDITHFFQGSIVQLQLGEDNGCTLPLSVSVITRKRKAVEEEGDLVEGCFSSKSLRMGFR